VTLELLPAVDVANGQAVRLVQGEAGSETSYGDPVEAALQWQRDGAEWVHLVDLDAAFGRGSNRELLAEVVGRLDIAVGLDVRGTTLAARGWTQDGGELFDVLARLDADGCARYVVTDVRRDGTLTGPNVELLQQVCAATDRPVVASGGVSSLDDLRALAALVPTGVEGAIVGKALYAGAFTLPEALAAVAQPPG
jgi:phosphoribosylanthranilate isomerase